MFSNKGEKSGSESKNVFNFSIGWRKCVVIAYLTALDIVYEASNKIN